MKIVSLLKMWVRRKHNASTTQAQRLMKSVLTKNIEHCAYVCIQYQSRSSLSAGLGLAFENVPYLPVYRWMVALADISC
jgi:hypothetical protein